MKLPFFFKKKKFINLNKIYPKIKKNSKFNDVKTLEKSKEFDLTFGKSLLIEIDFSFLKKTGNFIKQVNLIL